MDINNVPSTGGNYTVSYSFEDGVSRTVTASTNDNWITVSVDSSNIYIVIGGNDGSQRTGNVSVSVDNEVCSSKGIVIKQSGTSPTPTGDFDALLDEFNEVLQARGYQQVTSDMYVYNYLKAGYEMAETEYAGNNLYNESNFPEIYDGSDYRGDNDEYENDGTAFSAMTSWLMAMQLSELVPDSGDSTNTQTELFKEAYDIAGGDRIPLYGGYTFKGDPMVARHVASAIYTVVRNQYINNIDSYRDELGGTAIPNNFNFDGLYGASGPGYIVKADDVFPCKPGPYANGYGESSLPTGTIEDIPTLYYTNEENIPYWYVNNYKVDAHADKHVTDNYIYYTKNGESYVLDDPTGSSSKALNLMLVEAATIPGSSDFTYFGAKTVEYIGSGKYNIGGFDVTKFFFEETNESQTDDNQVYTINGPFSYLEDMMFNTPYNYNPHDSDPAGYFSQNVELHCRSYFMKFISKLMSIADDSRKPLMNTYPGRSRPLGDGTYDNFPGLTRGGTVDAGQQGQESTYNGLITCSLNAIFADNMRRVDTNTSLAGADDFPHDSARSYPSGHSAQVWFLALYLSQLFPNKLNEFMRNAYRFSLNRSVGRFHWYSDCIYGRLFGTFTLPIINAMTEVQVETEQFINSYNDGVKDIWDVDEINIYSNLSCMLYTTGEIRLYDANHSLGFNFNLGNTSTGNVGQYAIFPGDNVFTKNSESDIDKSDGNINIEVNGDWSMHDSYTSTTLDNGRIYVGVWVTDEHGDLTVQRWKTDDVGIVVSVVKNEEGYNTNILKHNGKYKLIVGWNKGDHGEVEALDEHGDPIILRYDCNNLYGN